MLTNSAAVVCSIVTTCSFPCDFPLLPVTHWVVAIGYITNPVVGSDGTWGKSRDILFLTLRGAVLVIQLPVKLYCIAGDDGKPALLTSA